MNGYLASRFGYRWVMIGAMGLLNVFIFSVFFAPNAGALVGGQILCGLCWGVFATLSPAYGESKFGIGAHPFPRCTPDIQLDH
jgi:SP family general alpha glucoside:H+ symporter-like MFS transporter